MPIPKPTAGEGKDEFISRCMSNETMKSDYPNNQQRVAVCYSSWNNSQKRNSNIHLEKSK